MGRRITSLALVLLIQTLALNALAPALSDPAPQPRYAAAVAPRDEPIQVRVPHRVPHRTVHVAHRTVHSARSIVHRPSTVVDNSSHVKPTVHSGQPTATQWAQLRNCESGGNYRDDTGNGFYGAYQFDLGTWHGLGYSGQPSDAPPAVQDAAAVRLYDQRGSQPWPECGRFLR